MIDPVTNRIVKHIENWNVEPEKVLRQLLLPASKVPVTRWEMFALSVNRGDVLGMWYFFAPGTLKLSAVALGFMLLERLFTGQSSVPWVAEIGTWHLAGIAATTSVRLLGGGFMQGGSTGTGGRF